MSSWQIVLLVVAAFLSLLLVPLGVIVRVEQGRVRGWLRVGFLKFRVKSGKKKAKPEPFEPSNAKPEEKPAKRDWSAYVSGFDDVTELLGIALKLLRRALRSFRISKLRLTVTVGTPDAAQTALLYGRLNAATAMALPVLYEYMRIRNDRIRYWVDFQKERTEYTLYLSAVTTPAALLALAVSAMVAVWRYWKPRRGSKTVSQQQ